MNLGLEVEKTLEPTNFLALEVTMVEAKAETDAEEGKTVTITKIRPVVGAIAQQERSLIRY